MAVVVVLVMEDKAPAHQETEFLVDLAAVAVVVIVPLVLEILHRQHQVKVIAVVHQQQIHQVAAAAVAQVLLVQLRQIQTDLRAVLDYILRSVEQIQHMLVVAVVVHMLDQALRVQVR